ncbi:MAG: HlyD family type I secretion periplasmic adaptor subunit [Magnetococcales bacterium]|nr:HlyD family type I secretion periplasmic adaptor subunit [Magnetococcales bacterium]
MSSRLKFQALSELLGRYGTTFRYAWQYRAEMEPTHRLPHEAQFLPAALSLQETPVAPAPRLVIWMLILFTVLAVAWSIIGQIDVVATAQGKVVPNGRTKTIQPIETATVKKILVRDGQMVHAGDVLIELDDTAAQADQERHQSDLIASRLLVARGRAMLAALESATTPNMIAPAGVNEIKFQEAQRQLAGQWEEYIAKKNRIEAEIIKKEAELRSSQEIVRKLEQTLPIARQRAKDFKQLLEQNAASKHGYLEREQARIEQEGDLATMRSRLKEIDAALGAARSQLFEISSENRRISLDSITDGNLKITSQEQELLKAALRCKLMKLISPVNGIVQQLAVHTEGGVVTPAQPVMVVVPDNQTLEVEAFIENKDIGFVQPDQEAEVKIETFQYTKYGTIRAQVVSVSHDAINDEKRGLVYSTQVRINKSTIKVGSKEVNLSPGMAVSVEIKIDKRRVIDYFLSPLIQYTSESLREL